MRQPHIVTGAELPEKVQKSLKRSHRPARLFTQMTPPPEPDYGSPDAWAALPSRRDDADTVPSNTKYPEAQKDAPVDVFFIHPTGYAKRDFWNGPIDDPAAVKALSLVMKYLAGSFNAAARVYAPRYRQATIYAAFDYETDSGIRAIVLAYSDVGRAFGHYLKIHNAGRPFILAGHSQGSMHGLRLLQEKIIGTPLQEKLVAAYLIGMAIPADIPGISPSRSAADTGGVISWTTYTSEGNPNLFTNDIATWYGGKYRKSKGLTLVQTNPLSWELGGGRVDASLNPGSLPFLGPHGDLLPLIPGVTGADASGEVLRIDKPNVQGFPGSGLKHPILNADFGDYHDYDYALFYESIRKNAIDRANAFIRR